MSIELPYGAGKHLQIDIAESSLVADFSHQDQQPLADIAAAVQAAVENPLDFPPLASALVPGDRVVLALERDTPRAAELVRGIGLSLRETSPDLRKLQVLTAKGERETLQTLPPDIADYIEVLQHDPKDRGSLSYLAASKEGKPIYLSQSLCDADVVVPIGISRLPNSLHSFGIHAGLFPTFSDEQTQQRFRAPSVHDWEAQVRRRRDEVSESAWLLGVQLVIQVVPGPGDTVLHVCAGSDEAVREDAEARCIQAWQREIDQEADLVVASIEGGNPSWDLFARALYSAKQAVAEGGAIVVCTDLSVAPGSALQLVAQAPADEAVQQAIRRERSGDATAAAILAEATQHARVYLLSRLPREQVEELGIGYVEKSGDVARLVSRADSCLLLGNAQHAVVVSDWSTASN